MGSSGRLLARALIRSLAPRQPSPNACLLNSRVNAGQLRSFSWGVETGGVQSLDQETERKAGWMLKALAAVTFTYVGLNVFPLMGDNLVKHSVRLLRTKDPLFRRSGASSLTLIATDDERRLRIVDAGGVGALVDMLQTASDDDTHREAAKALATLSDERYSSLYFVNAALNLSVQALQWLGLRAKKTFLPRAWTFLVSSPHEI
ncbi:unnamed protein product [Calypogeia fissa]